LACVYYTALDHNAGNWSTDNAKCIISYQWDELPAYVPHGLTIRSSHRLTARSIAVTGVLVFEQADSCTLRVFASQRVFLAWQSETTLAAHVLAQTLVPLLMPKFSGDNYISCKVPSKPIGATHGDWEHRGRHYLASMTNFKAIKIHPFSLSHFYVPGILFKEGTALKRCLRRDFASLNSVIPPPQHLMNDLSPNCHEADHC
jgi:hypothetical protein